MDNQDVECLLSMDLCIEGLAQAYRDLSDGLALSRPRSDIILPKPGSEAVYGFKSMEGAYPRAGLVALRINSDIIHWPRRHGVAVREKIPALPGGRYLGLVLLFSTENGELEAIFPDGVIQRLRVGATNALAAKLLARAGAEVYGLLGSGWQAGAQLMGMASVRRLKLVKVYSPTPGRAAAFAGEWGPKLGLEIRAVKSAEEAVRGSDIVGTATNAVEPVLDAGWIEPGMHLTSVKMAELDAGARARCGRVFILSKQMAPQHFQLEGAAPPGLSRAWGSAGEYPVLPDLVAGRAAGRQAPEEVSCFINNIGLGLQFAAVGAELLRAARAAGAGRELPGEWFTQDVHP